MKKIVAMLLVSMLLVTGCTKEQDLPSQEVTTGSAEQTEADNAGTETIPTSKEENPYDEKIIRIYHGYPTMCIDSRQEGYMNEYLERAGCDFKIKLVGNDTGLAYAEYLSQAKAEGEVIDIEWSYLCTNESRLDFIKKADAGEYYALNELLETENGKKLLTGLNRYMTPDDTQEKMQAYLEQYRMKDGKIYGIPMHVNFSAPYYLTYRADILDTYGVDALVGDMTDLDTILAKAKDMVADHIVPLRICMDTSNSDGLFGSLFGYEPYEVFWLLKQEEGRLEAINVFEEEALLQWYQKLGEWRQNGFLGLHEEAVKKIDEDQLLDIDDIQRKEASCIFPGTENCGIEPLRVYGGDMAYDVLNLETGLPIKSVLCINQKTRYPEEAFQLLEMMFYDTDFRRLMHLGPEGVGYTVEEADGKTFIKQYPTGTAGIPIGLGLEDDYFIYQKFDNEEYLMCQEKIYEGNAYAHPRRMGIADEIDFTPVKEAYEACCTLFADYMPVFYGLYGDKTKEELDNLYQKMLEAGYETVLAEINRQLGGANEEEDIHRNNDDAVAGGDRLR